MSDLMKAAVAALAISASGLSTQVNRLSANLRRVPQRVIDDILRQERRRRIVMERRAQNVRRMRRARRA